MPVPPATAARLDQIVMDVQRKGRAPSLIAAVTRGGEVEHLCAAGTTPEPTSDTQYRIGSITKTFTAMLIMQ
ncbi:MAG: serine hydrolase, partial [Micromonosporaceae bacterium]